ncbi:nucleotidyltransferase family protein [Cellvibrio mixtus]|uniref:nucleotidyltransferase family protein n=1 Tax=Cellvibrio mixtus TaxID=39650 RepID=UPI000586C6DF|nr:nucleotidyltransferase family protein [Cellvibrio mixtus]
MTIDCIILAAGAATRFGSCKLVTDYRGQPLISYVIETAKAVAPERIIIVTGASHEQLVSHSDRLHVDAPGVELAYCADWQMGMGHSLAHGVSQLENDKPVLVLLGDQPRISCDDVKRLYRLWNSSPSQIICASFADTLGVPAIFPASFKTHLRNCVGDRGAKQLLFNYAQHVVAVHIPSAEFDIDTPADLQRELAII